MGGDSDHYHHHFLVPQVSLLWFLTQFQLLHLGFSLLIVQFLVYFQKNAVAILYH